MKASLPNVTLPHLTPAEKKGLQDYWRVYEAHREEITAQVMQMASQHPEFKSIVQNAASQPSAEQQAASYNLQRNAILHDAWEPYLKNMQLQGMVYARTGLSFHAWFEIVGAFRRHILPYLLDAYSKTPQRLLDSMSGVDILIDTAMSVIGNSYLETKEELIREQAEAVRDAIQQKRSEEKFRALLESAPDAVVVVDRMGIIQVVNSQVEKLFGYNRAEIVGQSIEILVPKHLRKRHIKHREEYYIEHPVRPMGIGLELFGLRKNGTEFPVEISLGPLESEEGLLVSAAIRDVTQRKRNEDEIKKLNDDLKQRAAQLEAANKELESFSYSVSHDLRAPLRTIDGFSQALLEDHSEQLPPEARGHLERVRSAAQRMAILIDDLLNLSRITRAPLQLRFINLSAMAQEIAQALRESQPERQAEVSITPGLMVDGDPHLLHIALQNLLSNAWKFTSKQKQAIIEFGQQSRHNKERTFFVRDNGVGFDMAYADKLFGVFQRLHSMSEFPGTGVGLATVQRIINIHGGRIWAESAEGKGATFYFTL
ncbi:MAG: PAS domain S-box protein [Chloroflexi bacterium]|nr:PAS domain S-box protein [Chloroflexota bacterium]